MLFCVWRLCAEICCFRWDIQISSYNWATLGEMNEMLYMNCSVMMKESKLFTSCFTDKCCLCFNFTVCSLCIRKFLCYKMQCPVCNTVSLTWLVVFILFMKDAGFLTSSSPLLSFSASNRTGSKKQPITGWLGGKLSGCEVNVHHTTTCRAAVNWVENIRTFSVFFWFWHFSTQIKQRTNYLSNFFWYIRRQKYFLFIYFTTITSNSSAFRREAEGTEKEMRHSPCRSPVL